MRPRPSANPLSLAGRMRATTEMLLVPTGARVARGCIALMDRAGAAAAAAAAAALISLELSPPLRVANFLTALLGGCLRDEAGSTDVARAVKARPGVGGTEDFIADHQASGCFKSTRPDSSSVRN